MAWAGTLRGMTFPISSPRLQRLLGGSVAALLTANAFAAISLLGDDGDGFDRLRRPAATGDVIVPTAEELPTVTLITTADGRTFMADPSTAEGRRAIADARRDGGSVREVTAPRTATSERDGQLPGSDSVGGTALDLPGLMGSLLPGGGLTGEDDDGDGLLEIDPDDVAGLLQDPVGTVTSIVESTPTTVAPLLDDVTSTVDEVLDPVKTVTTLPPSTTIPPTPTTLTTTTTIPVPLVDQLGATVDSTVESITLP